MFEGIVDLLIKNEPSQTNVSSDENDNLKEVPEQDKDGCNYSSCIIN